MAIDCQVGGELDQVVGTDGRALPSFNLSAHDRARSTRSTMLGQTIDMMGVVVEELADLNLGMLGDDRSERVGPLAQRCGECADWPVATEDDTIEAEGVEDVVDDRSEAIGRPRARRGRGDDA